MTDLIPIQEIDDQKWCNARDLHSALQVGRDFSTWIKDRIEKYGFVEGEDFTKLDSPNLVNQITHGGDRKSIEYRISSDMAKELAMLENNILGKKIRKYFIEAEKIARKYAGDEILRLKNQILFLPAPVSTHMTVREYCDSIGFSYPCHQRLYLDDLWHSCLKISRKEGIATSKRWNDRGFLHDFDAFEPNVIKRAMEEIAETVRYQYTQKTEERAVRDFYATEKRIIKRPF